MQATYSHKFLIFIQADKIMSKPQILVSKHFFKQAF